MAETIRIRVLCFSVVRDSIGSQELALDLAQGATLDDVEAHVRALAGDGLRDVPLRMALNRCFARGDAQIAAEDEVAVIPPVQGG